jgi:hypothetical protein
MGDFETAKIYGSVEDIYNLYNNIPDRCPTAEVPGKKILRAATKNELKMKEQRC